MYTHTVESLTLSGRDRSLDYKISGFNIPRGDWGAKMPSAIAPRQIEGCDGDELVFPKCSSSVFVSTNIAYKLRNLGIKQVVLMGGLTDQCVDSAIRDACDEGFLVTVVTDACITMSKERHDGSLLLNRGYCRRRTAAEMVDEIAAISENSVGVKNAASAAYRDAYTETASLWAADTNSPASPTQSNGAPHVTPNRRRHVESSVPRSMPPSSREYVRFEVTDFNCKSLSKLVPKRHIRDPVDMYCGIMGGGANHSVLTFPEAVLKAGCGNARLVPDWETLTSLPWSSSGSVAIQRVYCEMNTIGGLPSSTTDSGTESAMTMDFRGLNGMLPRTAARRLLLELETKQGLLLYAASELEFCVAKVDDWSKPAFDGPEIFTTLNQTKIADFMYEVEESMAEVGIDVRTMNTEYGAGQIEITYAPAFGIAAADASATFKTGVKEIAQQRQMVASFQSKPFTMFGAGNGGHFNFSLWRSNENGTTTSAVRGNDDETGLSCVVCHFIAGVLAHAPALEAFCSPTPACYTRHGHWAPNYADWNFEDRAAAIRVKMGEKVDGSDAYFELRMPSASANAYLIVAGIVAAGLLGLDQELSLPPAKQKDVPLPTTLQDSLEALEADTAFREKIGEDLVKAFVALKRAELAAVKARIDANSSSKRDEAVLEAWRHFYFEFV